MFGFLLFVKSFHWLAGDRIEWVGESQLSGSAVNAHIFLSCHLDGSKAIPWTFTSIPCPDVNIVRHSVGH